MAYANPLARPHDDYHSSYKGTNSPAGIAGEYQFISLEDIINQFHFVYVGEDKLIPRARRVDVMFHAKRAMRELSFDTFKSCKAEEFVVPARLTMPLPRDYVNYTKVSWVDSAGIKHPIYPRKETGNPIDYYQNEEGDYTMTAKGIFTNGSNSVVLDGDYSDKLYIGLHLGTTAYVQGQVVTYIGSITTTAGVTTITMVNSTGAALNANISVTGPIPFTIDNDQPDAYKEEFIEKQATANLLNSSTSKYISLNNTTGLTPGMLVSHPAYAGLGLVTITDVGINHVKVTKQTQTAGPGIVNGDNIIFIEHVTRNSSTWNSYKSASPSENSNSDDYEDDTYWPYHGRRYGLDPQHSQVNGSYYIDCKTGLIHFSSNLNGKTVVLDYLSDGLGSDDEMFVHKFAEEAMYKWIMYGLLSGMRMVDPNRLLLVKKERFAETRKAKIRLSNIKLEEITQIFRGKSKQIKH